MPLPTSAALLRQTMNSYTVHVCSLQTQIVRSLRGQNGQTVRLLVTREYNVEPATVRRHHATDQLSMNSTVYEMTALVSLLLDQLTTILDVSQTRTSVGTAFL